MAVTLKDVLAENARRYHLELAAGRGGLGRVMKWVYVAEDYTTSDFLRGGELIITTGVISKGSTQWLLRFLHHIMQQNTCGLIINEGPYLSRASVTAEVLELCEANNFPLMLMPWHIHIYDVTRSCSALIFADSKRDETVTRAVRALLEPTADSAQALSVLPDYGFDANAAYYIAAFIPAGEAKTPLPQNGALLARFEAELTRFGRPWALVSRAGRLLAVFKSAELSEVSRAVRALLAQSSEKLCAGISGKAAGLGALARAGAGAEAAAQLGLHRGQQLSLYDGMGFFKLLLEIDDKAVLDGYIAEKLGPVKAHDEKHGTSLAETLRQYIMRGGNIQEVSQAMFCHRNTVRHRVAFLEQLLGCSLDEPQARFELMCALLAEEYREVCGK